MNGIDKNVLCSLYRRDLLNLSHVCAVGRDRYSSPEIRDSLKRLRSTGMIHKTHMAKTGRESIKVVLVGGVFDIIHPGHAYTLKSAKTLGDVLVVVVATDITAQKTKGSLPNHDERERQNLVNMLKPVDVCLVGKKNIFDTVRKVKPDIIALGYDQVHSESFIKKGCADINVEPRIVRLSSPIPKTSSREIQKDGKIVHDL